MCLEPNIKPNKEYQSLRKALGTQGTKPFNRPLVRVHYIFKLNNSQALAPITHFYLEPKIEPNKTIIDISDIRA